MSQRGTDDEGILGFLIDDIKKESRRVAFLKCFFCKKKHANLGCCVQICKKMYHIKCGRNDDASFEFVDTFPSYCKEHSKKRKQKKITEDAECGICMDKIKKAKALLIPCCRNSWFHRTCIQKFANTSGVFFKCPMCNDTKICKKKLPLLGILLPEKDADWYFDTSEFEDLNETLERICDAEENCRNKANLSEQWKLCSTCGASAIHIKCWDQVRDFVCNSCDEILNRPEKLEENSAVVIEKRQKMESRPRKLRQKAQRRSARINNAQKIHKEIISTSDEDDDSIVKSPMRKKTKFISWFSDDEQLSSSDEAISVVPSEPIRKLRSNTLLKNPPLFS